MESNYDVGCRRVWKMVIDEPHGCENLAKIVDVKNGRFWCGMLLLLRY